MWSLESFIWSVKWRKCWVKNQSCSCLCWGGFRAHDWLAIICPRLVSLPDLWWKSSGQEAERFQGYISSPWPTVLTWPTVMLWLCQSLTSHVASTPTGWTARTRAVFIAKIPKRQAQGGNVIWDNAGGCICGLHVWRFTYDYNDKWFSAGRKPFSQVPSDRKTSKTRQKEPQGWQGGPEFAGTLTF